MNVVERIKKKYPIAYNLMLDRRMRPVELRFGQGVSPAIQDGIMEGMDRVCVFQEYGGMPVSVEQAADGAYTLKIHGKYIYHFRTSHEIISFDERDMVEAMVWTIYSYAAGTGWLNSYEGKRISCKCFSARQQATALRIRRSVEAQYANMVPEQKVEEICDRIREKVSIFADRAPRFSGRPIPEQNFRALRGKTTEMELGDLAEKLYGAEPFLTELETFRKKVQSSPEYEKRLREICELMTKLVEELPAMSVSYFYTEFETRIDTMETELPRYLYQMQHDKVRFSLSAADIRSCFREMDEIYDQYLRNNLLCDFMGKVREETKAVIHQELQMAQRQIYMLRSALHRFCYVEADCFQNGQAEKNLTWKQLSELSDSSIYFRDVSWDQDSFNELQSVRKADYQPIIWISSDRLCNLAQMHCITDSHLVKPAPVMDEHFVWAIWAENDGELGV